MARIDPVESSKLPADLRRLVDADRAAGRDPALNGVLAHRPEMFRRYFEFYYPCHEGGVVEARIKELVRLKIARLNGCQGACGMARYASAEREGLDEEQIRQLDLPADRQAFGERERVALEFGERMALDHRSIDDAFAARLRKHFSDAQIVELGMMIGQYVGFGRLLVALGIQEYSDRPYRAGLG